MSEKPTAWWHNVAGTEWHLLSKGGTLGMVWERTNRPRGDRWHWTTTGVPIQSGTARTGDEARAAVSRELARRKESK